MGPAPGARGPGARTRRDGGSPLHPRSLPAAASPPPHPSRLSCRQPTSPPPSPLLRRPGLLPSLLHPRHLVLVPSHRRDTHPGGSASAGPLPAPRAPPPHASSRCRRCRALPPWVLSRSCWGGGRRGFLGLPAPPPRLLSPFPPQGAAGVGHCRSLLLLPALLASSGPCPCPHLYLHCPPTDNLSPLHPPAGPFSSPSAPPPPVRPSVRPSSGPGTLSAHCPASPGTAGAPLSFSSISSSLSLGPHHPPVFRRPVSVRFPVRLSVSLGLSRAGSVCLSLSFSAITISSHTAVQSRAEPPRPPPPPPSAFSPSERGGRLSSLLLAPLPGARGLPLPR